MPGPENVTCAACRQGPMHVFYELESVPASSCILVPTRDEALRYPRGDIVLGCCSNCGYIANTEFRAELSEYSDRYEASQSFSPTFDAFHRDLAAQLTQRYGLRDKVIVEIGCGKGEFLRLLCDVSGSRGVGFDPAYRAEGPLPASDTGITFVKEYYSETHAQLRPDLICCKMTLEHIPNPLDFVTTVRRSVGDKRDTVVFFQVPDAFRILNDVALEDIYFEHCSYFSAGSLARLFRAGGFRPLRLYSAYEGQYLMIDAVPECGGGGDRLAAETDLETLRRLVGEFPEKSEAKVRNTRIRFKDAFEGGCRTVLWGSGSKASAFLTTMNLADKIEFVVDINLNKHGYYMPGTGQRIVPPEFLKTYRPALVIAMNAIYRDEISRQLERMGVETVLATA